MAQSLKENWSGLLSVGSSSLAVIFHFHPTVSGALEVTMDVPDQGVVAMAAESAQVRGRKVHLEFAAIHAEYNGALDQAGSTMKGLWSQNGIVLPLNLEPVKDRTRENGPSTDLPYREQAIVIDNHAGGVTLAGTLTTPPGKGPFPAVILIGGSGPADRDETVFGHRPFRVLADALTRHGVAVLRTDKRGIGQSTGKATEAIPGLASDVSAELTYLSSRPEIDPHRIGLIGHSEGADVAVVVASRDPRITFVVMAAGSGLPGGENLIAQIEALDTAAGLPTPQIQEAIHIQREVYSIVRSARSQQEIAARVRGKIKDGSLPAALESQIGAISAPWFRSLIDFNPVPYLQRVRCPLLAVTGSLDLQVPARQNFAAIRAALDKGGNTDYRIVELPGLNHLFQHAQTGLPSEYGRINESIAPAALDLLIDWVVSHTTHRGRSRSKTKAQERH